jgi:apolipoprotein N-acyltransferase
MTILLQWKWQILAPLLGFLLTLTFAPYNFSYFAPIALVFFYSFCALQTPNRAAVSGYLFGLGLFGSGIWWVYVSIHDFGGAEPFFAGFLTVLLVALWAFFPALTAFLSAKVFVLAGVWFRILALGLVWVAVEYLRGYWLLNGFPWLQIAYSQLNTPLAGYAPVLGVYGVGFLLAVSACILFECWRQHGFRLLGILILSVIWGAGWGLQQVQWTHAIGEPITVTLIQGNIDQDQKWQDNQKRRTLALYRDLTEQHWDSNVIIWPETSVPAFLSEVKTYFLDPLSAQARQHGVDIVVSLPTEGVGRDYFNSVMTLGHTEALYHKQHLLPFGEYLPLQPVSGWVLDQLNIPLGSFTAGAALQPLLKAGGYAFVTTICYEDAFGELVAQQVEQAAYLVNVTNDAWFGDTSEPYQHMQLAQMRALETGRYLARATNTGLTGFVLPNGQISKQAPLFETTTLTDTIMPMAGLTPYARMGDKIVFAGLSVMVIIAFVVSITRQNPAARKSWF